MKTFRQSQVLFYYDGPQVIEGRDAIGGHYVGVRTGEDSGPERLLVVGARPEDLRRFRMGLVDLRSLFLQRPGGEWFLTTCSAERSEFNLEPGIGELTDTDYLPDEGFFLHDAPAAAGETLSEARARHNLVLEIAAEPPEAASEHRIRVETLTGLLTHVKNLVKHAYGAALKVLTPAQRQQIDRSDQHLLDVVVPAAAGSFKVMLEASKRPDMLGQSELARALTQVDELFALAGRPHDTLTRVKANRGHFSGAYARLLRFLVETDTGLRYQWAEPTFKESRAFAVSEKEARPIVDLLAGVSNLASETVELVGTIEKVDTKNGTWRISTPDGTYAGKTKSDGPSLAGLVTETKSYKFTCLEEIEETGAGREQRVLYLTEHEPLEL